jgi:hypothetical protein
LLASMNKKEKKWKRKERKGKERKRKEKEREMAGKKKEMKATWVIAKGKAQREVGSSRTH